MVSPRAIPLAAGLLCLGLTVCADPGSLASHKSPAALSLLVSDDACQAGGGGGAESGPVGQAPADSSAALTADPAGVYSLRGVYFNRRQFGSTADCLTAASALGLPFELCR